MMKIKDQNMKHMCYALTNICIPLSSYLYMNLLFFSTSHSYRVHFKMQHLLRRNCESGTSMC